MAPPLPNTMRRPRAIGLAFAVVGSLVWGVAMQPIKKQRGGRGLGLRWPPFCQQTQQPTESRFRRQRRHRRRRATAAERMWRLFWLRLGRRTEQKNKQKLKYHEALNGHKTTNENTTTNQKKAAAMEGTTEGRRDEREARGSAISLFFGGAKSN